MVNPSAQFVGFRVRENPSNFKAGVPRLCLRINAPANFQNVGMSADLRRDFLYFLIGFEVLAKFKPAEGGAQMIKVWRFEWLHVFISASHRRVFRKTSTSRSCDPRRPATFRTSDSLGPRSN